MNPVLQFQAIFPFPLMLNKCINISSVGFAVTLLFFFHSSLWNTHLFIFVLMRKTCCKHPMVYPIFCGNTQHSVENEIAHIVKYCSYEITSKIDSLVNFVQFCTIISSDSANNASKKSILNCWSSVFFAVHHQNFTWSTILTIVSWFFFFFLAIKRLNSYMPPTCMCFRGPSSACKHST